MRSVTLFATALATITSTAWLSADSSQFDQITSRIDKGGNFMFYMDNRGDVDSIGKALNQIYAEAAVFYPEMPAIPLDFTLVLAELGFKGIQGIGASSIAMDPGNFRNQSFVLLDDKPKGLLRVLGTENQPFTAFEMASANADMVWEMNLDATAIREVATNLATLIMGPMGAGMMDMQLNQQVGADGTTINNIIDALNTRITLIVEYTTEPETGEQVAHTFVAAKGSATLWNFITTMAVQSLGLEAPATVGKWQFLNAGVLFDGEPGEFILAKQEGDETLYMTTSREFLQSSMARPNGLRSNSYFQSVTKNLPDSGLSYYFQSERMSRIQIMSALDESDEIDAPIKAAIVRLMDGVMNRWIGGGAGVSRMHDGGIHSIGHGGISYKDVTLLSAAAVPTSIIAAMAVPAFLKTKEAAQTKTVSNNLAQIFYAAQQYMLENGDAEVDYLTLVETGFLEPLTPVLGEYYDDIVVTTDSEGLSVETADGSVITWGY